MKGTAEDNQYRPLLLVTISIGEGSQDVWMLVDSGADFTTIPLELATGISGLAEDDLGIPAGLAKGVGGEVPQRMIEAEASYRDQVFATRIFASQIPRPVLGRNDFMAAFNVQFCWGNAPPEFYVELSERLSPKKNLAIRRRRH